MSPWTAALLVVGYGIATYLVGRVMQDIYWRHHEIQRRRKEGDFVFALPPDQSAEIERLRALLSEARNDIRCDIENRYPLHARAYPSEARRYERDMDIVRRIDVALNGEPKT